MSENANAGAENQNGTENNSNANNSTSNRVSELPEWAQSEITEARNEAAKYRIAARDAKANATNDAKKEVEAELKQLGDEKAKLVDDLAVATRELDKIKVAISAEVPGESVLDFAGLLRGETNDELKAHAETLRKMMNLTGNAFDRSQGQGGEGSSNLQDPLRNFVLGQIDNKRNP